MPDPVFQRSPRLRPELPGGEVEVPAPPAAPSEPAMPLLSVLMALVPGLLGALVMYLYSRATGYGSMIYLAYSLPMMAAGYLVQVSHYWFQRRRYERESAARETKYRALLEDRRQGLAAVRQQKETALRAAGPGPAECLERIGALDSRLWERSPGDSDFLSVRLGTGTAPLGVAVKVPRPANALDEDPLYREAAALAAEFASVDSVPVVLPLAGCGAAGLAGARPHVINAARCLALQVAAHHSPDEVMVAAFFPVAEAGEWAWLRWLPHVFTDGRRRRLLAAGPEDTGQLLSHLQEMLQARRLAGSKQPAVVCLVGDPALAGGHPALGLLLQEGAALGFHPVLLAPRKEDLPMECRVLAELEAGGARLVDTRAAVAVQPFVPDEVAAAAAEEGARALAPVRLNRMAAPAAVPDRVDLLRALGLSTLTGLDLQTRWQQSRPDRSLAVTLGARAGGEPLTLDLHERAHGPHGLVAGATGSGKSELLQTLIAGLAVSYHPHEVAFVLVDYKGGGMSGAFRGLPHLTGTITNLEGGLARRALAALKAELKRRQKVLAAADLTHIDEYIRQRRGARPDLAPMPHLLLVVDEFAELKAEQPDFMRELISAVRVGRSLGIHLILATQKPAGVVDEQIWSNTRFRICLRVERPEDSQEVLRRPDAAGLTAAGRAYLQVGNHERFDLFQAGWSGAPFDPDGQPDRPPVAEIGLDGTRYPARAKAAPAGSISQLKALVTAIAASGIEPLPGPWLPPLPERLVLDEAAAPPPGWLEPVIGLADDPENQAQTPLRLDLTAHGHLAVYGAPGTGKSTTLQTLVTALTAAHPPDQLQVYITDGAGRGFGAFTGLPHVGAVIAVDETERIQRLMRHLLQELERRKERLGALGVSNLATYRRAGGTGLPALLVVLDNYVALAAAHPEAEEAVAQLAREGGAAGIHLALSAGSPSLVRHRVASNITLALALQLADKSEYSTAVGRTGGLEPGPIPGRGLLRASPPLEVQVALPAEGETEWERAAALKARFALVDTAWAGPRPEPIRTLPELVAPQELPPGAVGLEVLSLAPFRPDLEDGPFFAVCGPAVSGKTSLLRTWALALADLHPPDQLAIWLADPGGTLTPLARLPHARPFVTTDELAEAPHSLRLVVIDDFDLFRSKVADEERRRLEQLMRRDRNAGLCVLAAGSSSAFSQGTHEALVRTLLEMQTGFVLGSSEHIDLQILGLRLPPGETGRRHPPGQGYYARRGRARAIKAAFLDEAAARGWAQRIGQKEEVGR